MIKEEPKPSLEEINYGKDDDFVKFYDKV